MGRLQQEVEMNAVHLDMKVTCNTATVIETLVKNRENHAKIVAESRDGYLKKAREVLEQQLVKVQEGKIHSLRFALDAPRDFTSTYDLAIDALKAHTSNTIELPLAEFNQLMRDEWGWQREFYGTNKAYSPGATRLAEEKGF